MGLGHHRAPRRRPLVVVVAVSAAGSVLLLSLRRAAHELCTHVLPGRAASRSRAPGRRWCSGLASSSGVPAAAEEEELPKTLVVNLDRSPQRWARCREEFEREGIGVERFPATDGKAMSEQELRENCTTSARWFCTKGMLGCFMSHRRVWQKLDAESLPAAVVLEDDVRLYPGFPTRLRELKAELPADWDVCLLGAVACINPDVEPWFMKFYALMVGGQRPSPGRTRRISPGVCVPFRPAGTHAYMVSLKGARKLLERLPKAQYHVDLSAWALPDLRLYAATEFLATQSFDNDSTVSKAGDPLTRRFLRWCWSIMRVSKMAKLAGIEDVAWVWKVAVFALPVPFARGRRVAVDAGPSSSVWVMLMVASALLRSRKLAGIAMVYQGVILCICRYLSGTWSTRFFLAYVAITATLFCI